jgi:hypothetical protein
MTFLPQVDNNICQMPDIMKDKSRQAKPHSEAAGDNFTAL